MPKAGERVNSFLGINNLKDCKLGGNDGDLQIEKFNCKFQKKH